MRGGAINSQQANVLNKKSTRFGFVENKQKIDIQIIPFAAANHEIIKSAKGYKTLIDNFDTKFCWNAEGQSASLAAAAPARLPPWAPTGAPALWHIAYIIEILTKSAQK